MSATPFVSVVVPTRDRPEFLRWCMAALRAQSFDDFEVVVCDNPGAEPAVEVVTELADPRFRYVRPETSLAMSDNWEFAIGHARGEYVAMLTDKMALFPSALEHLHGAHESHDPDVVSWWNTAYRPLDESRDLGPGYYIPSVAPGEPHEISLRDVLARRLAFEERRDRAGTEYFLGKICFGAYRRDFVDAIRVRAGRVFFPIAPDYSSVGAASILAKRAVDLGRPLVASFESVVSNGKRQASEPVHARQFLHESDPTDGILRTLPIPGVYASVHNLVAYDLVQGATRAGGGALVETALDRGNLARRVAEDISMMQWDHEPSERDAQQAILDAWVAANVVDGIAARGSVAAKVRARARSALAAGATAERLMYRLRGRAPERYDDVVAALAAHDADA